DGVRHEVRATLTVGADGRGSRVRRLAGFEPVKTSPPMDVLWFRLPREPGDPEGVIGRPGHGRLAVLLDRSDHWQVGLVIPKGTYPALRAAGVESLRQSLSDLAPELSGRAESLTSWREVSLLSVESSRCRRWHRPGLLLIGDAAHVMSPVGGVGINYAIQDAVVAANLLSGPLGSGRVRDRQLAAVQRRRELPTRVIQAMQALVQSRLLAPTLDERPFDPPKPLRLLLRLPLVRDLPARGLGFGMWRVRVVEPGTAEVSRRTLW
ncbi:MAG: FAD-dependent monooxygenase, partial [Rubrobacter sp.]|nr:FAD-dependent monooxygenase [Rubrobacter sp.]